MGLLFQPLLGGGRQLILHNELYRRDPQTIAGRYDLLPDHPLAVNKGPIDAGEILDGDITVVHAEQAMTPADPRRGGPQITFPAPTDERL